MNSMCGIPAPSGGRPQRPQAVVVTGSSTDLPHSTSLLPLPARRVVPHMNSPRFPQAVSIDQLVAEFRSAPRTAILNEQHGIPVAFATGVHAYFQINLTLPLSAAED